MPREWLTIASPTKEAMVNPLIAACEGGYVPDTVRILSNPTVRTDVDKISPLIETIGSEYGSDLSVEIQNVSTETEFSEIATTFRTAIEAAGNQTQIAVDITPGRKFMSAIAFQAGVQYGADHVYYLLVDSSEYYSQVYPDIPAPATELIDFTEVV